MRISKLMLGGLSLFLAVSFSVQARAHRSLKAPPRGHFKGEIPTAYTHRYQRLSSAEIKKTFQQPIYKLALRRGWVPKGTAMSKSGLKIISAAYTFRNMPYTSRHTRQDHMLVQLKSGDVHVVRLQRHDLPTSPIGPWRQRLSLSGFGSQGVVSQLKAEGLARKALGLKGSAQVQRLGLKGSSYLFASGSSKVLVDVWTGAVKK